MRGRYLSRILLDKYESLGREKGDEHSEKGHEKDQSYERAMPSVLWMSHWMP